MTSSNVKSIVSCIESIYTKYEGTQQEEDLCSVFVEKVPAFIEKTLRDLESRRQSKTHIEETIQDLYEKCVGKYVYNADLNAFYEIQHFPVQLQLIFSDSIWMKLSSHIPSHTLSHKSTVYRGIRQKLMTEDIFKWTPPASSIKRMVIEVKRNFCSEAEAHFLMQIIGAIILRKEDILMSNVHGNVFVHLWFGPRMEEVAFTIQDIIYNATHYFSPFWKKIKHRIHHSYSLPDICYLCFPTITHKTPFRVIKQSPLLFLTVCTHMFRTQPLFIHQSSICRTLHTHDTQQLFERYASDNLVLSPISQQPLLRFLLLREIMLDFKHYLFENQLPADILSKQHIIQYIIKHIPYETYGTRSVKKIFYATFAVSSGNTVQEIFDQFCTTLLEPNHDQTTPTTTFLTTRQLHNNYRVWCKFYVQHVSVEDDMAIEDDHYQQHWYCSYNLFVALFQRKYTIQTTYNMTVCPPSDIWKVYLQTYASQNQTSNMDKWAKDEYGIDLSTLSLSSNTLEAYEEKLIVQEIENIYESKSI